jgi:hypothetical protein
MLASNGRLVYIIVNTSGNIPGLFSGVSALEKKKKKSLGLSGPFNLSE